MTSMQRKLTRWSPNEIALLKKLYSTVRVRDLVGKFPKRTADTIVAKAQSLTLPSAKLWQPEENQMLRTHFAKTPRSELRTMLSKRSWVAIMAQAERLGLKRLRRKPRLAVKESYFRTWSPNMAYILGFIVSDGCIVHGTYRGYSDALKFGVHQQDRDVLEKIKWELSAEHKISPTKNAVHLCITSQNIVDDLKMLGVTYQKSLRENVPPVPPVYIRDFIRGIVDGDGGISIDTRGHPTLRVCGGEQIIGFIRDLFLSVLGAYSSVATAPSKKSPSLKLCDIAYRSSTAQSLIKYLYQDVHLYLDRKYQRAMQGLKTIIKAHGIKRHPPVV